VSEVTHFVNNVPLCKECYEELGYVPLPQCQFCEHEEKANVMNSAIEVNKENEKLKAENEELKSILCEYENGWDFEKLEEENRRLRVEIDNINALNSVLFSTIGELNLASQGCYSHIIEDMKKNMDERIKYLITIKKEQGE
jgi:SMC interacting uncharacterized protein involved in chromosome segregation